MNSTAAIDDNLYSGAFPLFYDQFYTLWTQAAVPDVVDYLARNLKGEKAVIDLCCGTGVAATALLTSGWSVVGIDKSPAMLSLARRRIENLCSSSHSVLLNADAREFEVSRRYAACVALDGSLNHLPSFSDLVRCFRSVSKALGSGGHFLFDLMEPFHFQHWRDLVLFRDHCTHVKQMGFWVDDHRWGCLRIFGTFRIAEVVREFDQFLTARAFSESDVITALTIAGLVPVQCGLPAAACDCGQNPKGKCRTFYQAIKP